MADVADTTDTEQKPWDMYGSKKPWELFQGEQAPVESQKPWEMFGEKTIQPSSTELDKTLMSQLAVKVPEIIQEWNLDFPEKVEGLSDKETGLLNSLKKDIVLKEATRRAKESPLTSAERGAVQFTSEAAKSMQEPENVALAGITAIAPPVGIGIMAGLAAKTIGEGAGTLSVPGLGVTDATKQILNMAAMTAGAVGATRIESDVTKSLAPDTAKVLEKTVSEFAPETKITQGETPVTTEVQNASDISKTTEVHGDVLPLEKPTEKLPTTNGEQGIQPQTEGGIQPVQETTTSIGNEEVISPHTTILHRITDAIRDFPTTLKALAGESMPRTTAADRLTGEAGVRYGASRIAAQPMADVFTAGAVEGTGVDINKLGAALTEDNLRSVRQGFEDQAKELLSKGDEDGAAGAVASAQQVHSLIGGKKSPFKTEAEYQDYLKQTEVQQAIEQYKRLWQENIDPQFKAAQGIDPDVQLPTRGLQTGARINLKAIQEGETGTKPVGAGPSLTATFKRKSPFAGAAKGTGESYETNLGELMRNTYGRQLEIANKNLFDKSLVESGNAQIAAPGSQVSIEGEGTTAFPLQRRLVVTSKDGNVRVFPKDQNIYVKNSLSEEYRAVSNVDKKFKSIPGMNFLNKTALAGLTDATVHVSNQMTALFNRPVSGGLLLDSLLSATGRADIPVTLAKGLFKALKNNEKQIAELSEIGAMRERHIGVKRMGRLLSYTDKITRLLLDDTFNRLSEAGLFETTETARREYVNQIGQYNRRLQGPMIRFFRDTGLGPFVTAGRTFNALGVKMIGMSPGAKATSPLTAAMLRANILSKWIGAVTLIGSVNYLITKNVAGRPGVPVGNIDTGKDDESGKPLSIPALDIIGLGRGLRVTGIKGAGQALYLGLPKQVAADSAVRDIVNSATGPFSGPAVRFAKISSTGTPTAINVGRVSPVVPPGQNQTIQNIYSAAKEANPIVKSILDKVVEGKSTREAIAGQLPRFTATSGKPPEMVENYPEIVHKAQLNTYLDDVVHRARKMSDEKRLDYIENVIEGLDPEDRKMAERIFKFRKVR